MSQLTLKRGLRLRAPIGVSWLQELSHGKLLNLKPRSFVWFTAGDDIECAEVSAPSRSYTSSDGKRTGVQVYYTGLQVIESPRLIFDNQPSGIYMIADREAAFDYYERQTAAPVWADNIRPLRKHMG